MSEDRPDRPVTDDWFRDEPGIPPATSAPYQSQGGQPPPLPSQPQAPQQSNASQSSGTGSSAWDEYRSDHRDTGADAGADADGPSLADAPTQVGGIRAIRPAAPREPREPLPVFPPMPQQEPREPLRQQAPREPLPQQREPLSRPERELREPFPQQRAQGEPLRPPGPMGSAPDRQPFHEAPGHSYPEYEPHEPDRREPAQSNRTPMIVGGVVTGVAVLGLIAYMALGGSPKNANTAASGGGAGAASPSPTHTSFQPTSSDPATAAEQTGTAFLNAWQSGDLQAAAKYTDNPTAALAAMNDYKSGLNLSALALKPQPAVVAGAAPNKASSSSSASAGSSAAAGAGTGTTASPSGTVPFSVSATVSLGTQSATGQMVSGQVRTAAHDNPMMWSYKSSLVAYKQSDGWSVRWNSSILAPNLTSGEKLSVVSVPAGAGKVVDASGTNLSSYSETALQNIDASLGKKAPTGNGTPGTAVQIVDASGKAVGAVSATLVKPVDATVLKTTINPSVEALARSAVAMHARSSMVVLRPSTGAILAVANSSSGSDTALAGGLAPGSTFKIITSTALLDYGYVSLYTPVACPLTFTVQGVVYHNSTDASGKNEESLPAGTPFITDFAQSCNNAFTPFYKQLEGGKLASTAADYFGLNQSWDIGLGSNSYFGMPTDSSGAELAQEDFGQGQVVASPLAMASVAATVGTGSFNQPYLVNGVTKAAAKPLPSGTDSNLKTLMHAVVTSGTAAGVFSGVAGPVYAKTGTAETDANKDGKPNAWVVVYDPQLDIALGVVVQDSGFGATFAGPQAAYVLSRL